MSKITVHVCAIYNVIDMTLSLHEDFVNLVTLPAPSLLSGVYCNDFVSQNISQKYYYISFNFILSEHF